MLYSVQKTKMRNVLAEELASCQQLLDLEPDNKCKTYIYVL